VEAEVEVVVEVEAAEEEEEVSIVYSESQNSIFARAWAAQHPSIVLF
jgi:hypothetical protein